jgi:hypothetical protein
MPPPSAWSLPRAVQATAVAEDLVFLDVESDAYFCLPDGAAQVRVQSDGRGVHVVDEGLAASLAAAGLLQPGAPDRTGWARPRPPLPTASAVLDAAPPPGWRDLGDMARSMFGLMRRYHRRSFAEILAAAVRDRPSGSPGTPSPDLLAVVHRFHRWVPYAPVSGKCLLRSFMLLQYLRRNGHDAAWVFGVTTWPFEAHCWLQCGDVALDDHFERLWPFQPILAL